MSDIISIALYLSRHRSRRKSHGVHHVSSRRYVPVCSHHTWPPWPSWQIRAQVEDYPEEPSSMLPHLCLFRWLLTLYVWYIQWESTNSLCSRMWTDCCMSFSHCTSELFLCLCGFQAPSFYWEIEIISYGDSEDDSGPIVSFGFSPEAEKRDGAWTNPVGTCLFHKYSSTFIHFLCVISCSSVQNHNLWSRYISLSLVVLVMVGPCTIMVPVCCSGRAWDWM